MISTEMMGFGGCKRGGSSRSARSRGRRGCRATRLRRGCTSRCLFDPDFCNVASGWEKGRVEKNVQDSQRHIWIDAAKQRLGSFVELNAWLAARCRALWEVVRHAGHRQFSVAERHGHERAHLMPCPRRSTAT